MKSWAELSDKEKKKYSSKKEYASTRKESRKAGDAFDTGGKAAGMGVLINPPKETAPSESAFDTRSKKEKKKGMETDISGSDATHFIDKKDKTELITEDNNPFEKKLSKFDTTATGAGARKGTERYSASDMKGHLAAGKSKEEIVAYAEGLDDNVKMGAKAQGVLNKFKADILAGKKPGSEEGSPPSNEKPVDTNPIAPTPVKEEPAPIKEDQ